MIFVSSHPPTDPRPREGRKTTKISVTVPTELVDEMRERAKGNVSRWVTEAIERKLRRDRLREWIDESMEGEEPFTEEERAQVRAQWRSR
jgi:post-segregation antitoxin (ccd killing protein)